MNNAEYWAQRLKPLEDAILSNSYKQVKVLERQFDLSIAQLDEKIRAWYQRFAENNDGISYAEAQRLLTTGELKEFKWSVQEYIKRGQEHAISGAWAKELENASARVHISRLESLKLQLRQMAEELTQARVTVTERAAGQAYTQSYYHTAFEVQRGIGVGWAMQVVDENRLKKVLARPWTADGQTFSARCWRDKSQLVETVNRELMIMVATGATPDKAIANIAKQFGASKSNAGRLVMTESAAMASTAQGDCFNELGVEQYQIIETLDNGTCERCGELDGKVFPMDEYRPGSTAPPFHPWCRGCTAPYFEDMQAFGEKAARGADGKTYSVPKNMTYREWKTQQETLQKTGGLAAGNGSGLSGKHAAPELLKTLDNVSENTARKELLNFEKTAILESIETACVVTKTGEVYKCFGTANKVFPDEDLGDKLKGAWVSHNHPIAETEYSFSDMDLRLFQKQELAVLRGCDEKYVYELNRNPSDLDVNLGEWKTEEMFRHTKVIEIAQNDKIGYRRWKR